MIEGINFIGNEVSKKGSATFKAKNPADGNDLSGTFHIATNDEINQVLSKAAHAFKSYRNCSGSEKAAFLETIADEIMSIGDELIERAMAETGLPSARLQGERGRTCNQLRMFAELLRVGSWVDARIDTAQPERTPPKPDIRSMLIPLGPVVVFGASNFPLAFSTAGGDTASALASGCPVVVKGHESHPGTNELVSRAIIEAVKKTGMPDGTFGMVIGGPETGAALVKQPLTKAVGFTGSFKGGKAIYDLAQQREEPIPVYAEMGSINPVFLLEEKLQHSAEQLAEQYASSVTLGVGQFCTNPGLIVGMKSESLDKFKKKLSAQLDETPPGCMLNSKIAENYRKKRASAFRENGIEVLQNPKKEAGNSGSGSVTTVSAAAFLDNEELHEEVFGPYTLIVECSDAEEREKVAGKLKGQLTVTFVGTDEELGKQKELVGMAREIAGRVVFNGVPTGVDVCSSMQHGGPFPATTDSKFTSVGTRAILRFVRPMAFQDSPQDLLPDELKDENPLRIFRQVNSTITSEQLTVSSKQ